MITLIRQIKCDRCGLVEVAPVSGIRKITIFDLEYEGHSYRGDLCQLCYRALTKELEFLTDKYNLEEVIEDDTCRS